MRVLLVQSGGPTTVLNASLAGALGILRAAGCETMGARDGARGLASGPYLPLAGPVPAWLPFAPGAALGAGRGGLDADQLAPVVRRLDAEGFGGCLLFGGNGTMALGAALLATSRALGTHLSVVGVPKTIDNDLEGTDHTPGYPSAASFVAAAVRDMADDLDAMAGFEDVRLIEVMGRRAGWLAGAAVLARRHPEDAPHFVLIPEVPVDIAAFVHAVGLRRTRGPVLVVVAEGVVNAQGRALGQHVLDPSGRTVVFSGAAQQLSAVLRARLGLRSRAESLGFLPRCLRLAQTARDRQEAQLLGARAAQALVGGEGGCMVGLAPAGRGVARVPLEAVAGRERRLPAEMRDLGQGFIRWLAPLVEAPSAWPPARLI